MSKANRTNRLPSGAELINLLMMYRKENGDGPMEIGDVAAWAIARKL